MSVTKVPSGSILQTVEKAQTPNSTVYRSFFELFGTANCRLNCKALHEFEMKILGIAAFHPNRSRGGRPDRQEARRAWSQELHSSQKVWFNIDDLQDSAAKGCGSCEVLNNLFHALFAETRAMDKDRFQYAVSSYFVLTERCIGQEEQTRSITIFQPPGQGLQLNLVHVANFLCSRDDSMARLKKWLKDCSHKHTTTCSSLSIVQDDTTRPSRLIDIAETTHATPDIIRLVNTESAYRYKYACLSHRWDAMVGHLQTDRQNISQRMTSIDLQTLPKNFRDGIWIARQLGIGYIWIDSLCIIQHGDGGVDKSKELAKMGHIYRGAYLTIAAMSSADSAGGCFPNNSERDACFIVEAEDKTNHILGARILDGKGRWSTIEAAQARFPLLTRGWILQERLLSPRFLECNYGEFTFACLQEEVCECDSNIAPHLHCGGWTTRFRLWVRQRIHLGSGTLHKHSLTLKTWKAIIGRYTQLSLTHCDDVLPAIAGVAEILGLALGYQYVAGMWKETLESDLLWFVGERRPGLGSANRTDNGAPTWSWASVRMEQIVSHPHLNDQKGGKLLEKSLLLQNAIKSIETTPEMQNVPFGKLIDAHLELDCILYPWYIRWFCKTSEYTNSRRMRSKTDLHLRAAKVKRACAISTPALDVNGAHVHLYFDDPSSLEPVKLGIVRDVSHHCKDKPPFQCGLGQIYLLHAVRQRSAEWNHDAFLVLKKIPPHRGKPNCYSRIGFLSWNDRSKERRTWEEVVKGKTTARRETLWLF